MKDSQHLQWIRNRLATIDQVDNRTDYIMRLNRIIERIAAQENSTELALELAQEQAKCAHMFLDDKGVLRREVHTQTEYSLIGRIKLYKNPEEE
tara:strand:+ start:616 stop:897 length:282 start_codon:yes stop_codon:yes gene_type:complete